MSNTILVEGKYRPFRWEGEVLKAFDTPTGKWITVEKTKEKKQIRGYKICFCQKSFIILISSDKIHLSLVLAV